MTWLWIALTLGALALAGFVAWVTWEDREYGGLAPLWWVPVLLFVAYGLSFGNGPFVEANTESTAEPSELAVATTTTKPDLTTTTVAPVATADASVGRPVYAEFNLLMAYDDDLRATCEDTYPGNIPACYDAFERGTTDFETTIESALEAHLQAIVDGARGYAANQYGCHDDGRCLDDAGEWCWESEVAYLDGFGLACPGTAEALAEQEAEDLFRDQMEEERYGDVYP